MSPDFPRLDIREPARTGQPRGAGRAFLGLWFTCAGVYGRAYKSRDGRCYLGRCPRCGATVRFGVGAGGTADRFFRVNCR